MKEHDIPKEVLAEPIKEYYLSWYDQIGERDSVLYNGIGPDITMPLLVTNFTELEGRDELSVTGKYLDEYINKYWEYVDSRPIYRAGAFFYGQGTVEEQEIKEDDWERFAFSLSRKKEFGYYDVGDISKWDIERLVMRELKCLGVRKEDIYIGGDKYSPEINFSWQHPRDNEKKTRKLTYKPKIEEELLEKTYAACLQKSLFGEKHMEYIPRLIESLEPEGVALLGRPFEEHVTFEEWQELIQQYVSDSQPLNEPPFSPFHSKEFEYYYSQEDQRDMIIYGILLKGFKKK